MNRMFNFDQQHFRLDYFSLLSRRPKMGIEDVSKLSRSLVLFIKRCEKEMAPIEL
jgi:hypothetical protein